MYLSYPPILFALIIQGSGKTLAFSIPILHHILKVRPPLTSADVENEGSKNKLVFEVDSDEESANESHSQRRRMSARYGCGL